MISPEEREAWLKLRECGAEWIIFKSIEDMITPHRRAALTRQLSCYDNEYTALVTEAEIRAKVAFAENLVSQIKRKLKDATKPTD